MIAFSKEPGSPDRVFIHISEGGTLRSLAASIDVRYADLYEYVHGDVARLAKYTSALESRESNHRDLVTEGLLSASTVDLRRLYDVKGRLLPLHKLPDDVAAAMQGVEVVEGENGRVTTKYRMQDRTKNRELLGKIYGMFTDKVEHAGHLTLEQMVAASMAPVKA